jgi:hypothetical protein
MDINHSQDYLLLTRQAIDGDQGNYPWRLSGHSGIAHGAPGPKGHGNSFEDLSQGVHGRPPGNFFFQKNTKFCLGIIFPRNLPFPTIALGDFERGDEFLTE